MSIDTTVDRPVSTIDPFSHGFLTDPYPHHEAMREAGPVVWLEQYGIWAMARHQEVRDGLTDWQTYCSVAGGDQHPARDVCPRGRSAGGPAGRAPRVRRRRRFGRTLSAQSVSGCGRP